MDLKDIFIGHSVELSISELGSILTIPPSTELNHYFTNSKWEIIELENDYFLESINFSIVQSLMKENDETSFYLTTANIYNRVVADIISIDFDIGNVRQRLIENHFYFFDWYLISHKFDWAAISIYDKSELFIGYNPQINIENVFMNNPNVVRKFTNSHQVQ